MKKVLLSLAAVALSSVLASADNLSITWENEGYGNGDEVTTVSKTPVTLTFAKGSNSNSPKYYNTGKAIRLYGGNTMTVSVSENYTLNKVVITTKDGKYVMNANSSATNGTFSIKGTTATWTANGSQTSTTITQGGTTGHARIVSTDITYTKNAGPTLEDPEISFPEASYEVKLGEAFTAPVATAKSDGVITYTSSDESVATVNSETGAVEILATGTTKVTANIAATDTYTSGIAEYTLTVTDPTTLFSWSKDGGDVFTYEQISGTVEPWSVDPSYGLKGSAYKGGINACEAIAASPVIDLEGKKEITLNFRNAFNNYKVNNNMIDVADFPGKYAFIMVKEEGANDWTELCEPTAPAEFSWNFYDNDVISLDAYKDKKIQVGFKYVSTEQCAGTWEIDNIKVNGKVSVGVDAIEAEENVAPVYYNLQGVRVAEPSNGLYIVVKGGKSSKVLVK